MFNQKEYQKQWYIKNREKLLEKRKEYGKQWRKKNKEYYKEHYKEYGKEYRKKNKEKEMIRHKRWREKTPEYSKEYMEQWRRENPDNTKEYYEKNKERKLEYTREHYKTEEGKACNQRRNTARRTRIKKVINNLTANEWLDILKEHDYRCIYCGKKLFDSFDTTRDHIIPISKGGNNVKENIVPACRSCNAKKSDKIL